MPWKQITENRKIDLKMTEKFQTITVLTAGGKIDAEIATPTNDPIFSPSMAIATAAPDGRAVKTPTINECISHLREIKNEESSKLNRSR